MPLELSFQKQKFGMLMITSISTILNETPINTSLTWQQWPLFKFLLIYFKTKFSPVIVCF